MTFKTFSRLGAAVALCFAGSAVHAQAQSQPQPQPQQQPLQGIEPVVPVGPAVMPAGPTGPAIVPVIPVEKLQGVETVTLNTPRGPVVVVSWPTSGAALSPDSNIDFSRIDTDRDGMVSRAEIDAAAAGGGAAQQLATRFQTMDTSRDGKLSFVEVVDWVHR